MAEKTQAETSFIDQMTRKLLVELADKTLREGTPDGFGGLPDPYLEHALSKGWVSKRNPNQITGKGFGVAAAFLKR